MYARNSHSRRLSLSATLPRNSDPRRPPTSGNGIAGVGERKVVIGQFPDARVEELPGCLLLAGFVNAHQHGRGVSQVQLGYQDDFLEAWISSRRARGVLDPYRITKLAAVNMI